MGDPMISQRSGTIALIEICFDSAAIGRVGYVASTLLVTPPLENVLRNRVAEAKGNELEEALVIDVREISAAAPYTWVVHC